MGHPELFSRACDIRRRSGVEYQQSERVIVE